MSKNYTLQWDNKTAINNAREATIEGLTVASEALLDESLKLVPLDEGTLANSGNSFVDTDNLTAYVFFDTPYAVRQHEDLTLTHANGRQAKYLETPFKQFGKKYLDYIGNRVKDAIGGK